MDGIEQSCMRKIYLRLLPFAIISYFLAYIDRINVSFAALTMRGDPPEIAKWVQAPVEQDETRRDTEVDEIHKTVEFGAEARRTPDHARDAAIDRIKHGGKHDRGERKLVALLEGEADAGEARTKREQGNDIRHQPAHRNLAQALHPALVTFGVTRVRHAGNIAVRAPSRYRPKPDG